MVIISLLSYIHSCDLYSLCVLCIHSCDRLCDNSSLPAIPGLVLCTYMYSISVEELTSIKYYCLKSLILANKTLPLLWGLHSTSTRFLVCLTHHMHITQKWHYRKCLWISNFVGHLWFFFSSRIILFNTNFMTTSMTTIRVFLLMDFTWGTLECFFTPIIIATVFQIWGNLCFTPANVIVHCKYYKTIFWC